jgi:hypothetical protein
MEGAAEATAGAGTAGVAETGRMGSFGLLEGLGRALSGEVVEWEETEEALTGCGSALGTTSAEVTGFCRTEVAVAARWGTEGVGEEPMAEARAVPGAAAAFGEAGEPGRAEAPT